MTFVDALPFLMFACLLVLIMTGYPVAFALSGTALLFALIGYAADVFHLTDLGFIPTRVWGTMSNFTLVAVPLFIFMGLILTRSGVAEELLDAMSRAFRRQRGSLAMAVVVVGALLAASTGVAGATIVTMGVLTLPTMLARGYDKGLATGTIAASGTLGQIIPPSIILVLLGDMMNVDVGDLFIGALIPGMTLVAFYLIYVKGMALLRPETAPAVDLTGKALGIRDALRSLAPPAVLMLLVLGSILVGAASPTEAAASGAVGAVAIALAKRRLGAKDAYRVAAETAEMTSMVFFLLVGAQFFGVVFRGLSGDEAIAGLILGFDLPREFLLVAVMLILFGLGFFLDFLEICFIVIPILQPIMLHLGFDPLWVAILIAVNLQTSFLTPPFGFALFYLKGVAPPEVTTVDIYRGVFPFLILQLLCLLLVGLFPELATWLPRTLLK